MNGDTSTKADKRPEHSSVLVLQGLATPFLSTLSAKLASDGYQVHRVHFCGADWLFRGKVTAGVTHHAFTGKLSELDAFYAEIVTRENITAIFLLGDCRPIHKPAVKLAQKQDIALYAFDEGYIRPGWITMEASGTNGYSRMPKNGPGVQDLYRKAPATGRGPAIFKPAMGRRVWMDLAGHAANILMRPKFRHYRGHRPEPVWREAKGWISRGWNALVYGGKNDRTLKEVALSDQPYFLVPLQLNSDYQIRLHSRFSGMPEFIEEVMTSFKAHAPADTRLFFKNHPLDNGIINYRRLIERTAATLGITDRVSFAAGGDLNHFLERCRGVVLVNSTVGFAALRAGRPLKALGQALYDMGGLTDQQPLDTFWKKPIAPQQRLAEEFLTVVETYTQVRGDLFSAEGIACAAEEATQVVAGILPRLPAR